MLREMRRRWISALVAATVLVAVMLSAASAFALTDTRITLNQQTGGKPTRFTFLAKNDPDAPMTSAELVFPKGFDLSKCRPLVDIVIGVTTKQVPYKKTIEGSTLKLDFEKDIPAGTDLRIVVWDVVTLNEGGTYTFGFKYGAGGEERELKETLEFQYNTPPPWEKTTRWLDEQPFVAKWNNVKFLNIFFRPQYMIEGLFLGFTGWLVSLSLVALAFPLAILGGLALAFIKMSKIPPARWIANGYVNVIRGTPLFLQIYIAFIGLRIAGIRMNDFSTAVIVLMMNSSAYLAEIFRAGIQSIHKGQMEAALSLGMTYPKAMVNVIIPQTVKRVLPTMTSEFILLFKDTSLLFPVGVFELMMYSNQIVARSGNLSPFMVAAIYYLIVTIPLINWVSKLEAKLALAEHGQGSVEQRKTIWDRLARRQLPLPVPETADREAV